MTNLRYEQVPIVENNDLMVNLENYPFVLAPMYFDWGLSNSRNLWVRQAVANKLSLTQEEYLKPLGRKFKIWDPWRPRTVQDNIYQKYWNELSEEHSNWDEQKLTREVGIFVTKADDLNRIPPHSTGGSVDLTVVEADGNEMDLGTVFDHFGSEAATDYFEKNEQNNIVRDNRRWLQKLMLEVGFGNDIDEWWHFDYGNQKWALLLGHDTAFYGEIHDPTQFNLKHDNGMKHALT